MRVAVVGVGAVGTRAARQLVATPGVVVVVADADAARAAAVAGALGPPATAAPVEAAADGAAAVVLAFGGDQRPAAERALDAGASVVSTADGLDTVRRLLDLDAEARERGRHVVVGAGFSPGLSCLLARHAAATLSAVEEIHVARFGTGGPQCARQHHRALGDDALDWREGWARRRGGSGRELCWFPDPVGARDCYRAALPDALLLAPAFPGVRRVTARMAANRRDRVTARLPMLRRPHPEGSLGALRVEVRGRRDGAYETVVLGAVEPPAVAAGTVAAVAALWATEGRLTRTGAGGLAALAEPLPFLQELARRGVRAAVFEGRADSAA
jgi:saccharopine dehydrogenase-like NADP-dependent oxidoreductase